MPDVRIFTTRFCPYCFAAKRLLGTLGIEYAETHLDNDPELRQRLGRENGGWKTVPMVFIGDRFVGGFSELSDLHESGRLQELASPNSTC
jgi:glutaredoxin 3